VVLVGCVLRLNVSVTSVEALKLVGFETTIGSNVATKSTLFGIGLFLIGENLVTGARFKTLS
jgi:hypothetical protein